MLGSLPLLSASSPCHDCAAPCCVDPEVRLDAYDLWRLAHGLGAAWPEFAEPVLVEGEGFALDRSAVRFAFRLRQNAAGTCLLALRFDSGALRCGVHGLRPSSCRIYPYHVELPEDGWHRVGMGTTARCPPEAALAWQALDDDAVATLDEAVAERALTAKVQGRWSELVHSQVGRLTADDFVRWSGAFYQRIEPWRAGERETWQLSAYRALAAHPLYLQRGLEPWASR